MYYLCVGHSHLDAIKNCYTNGKPLGIYDDIELNFVELRAIAPFEYYGLIPNELGEELRSAFDAVLAERRSQPAGIFMTVGGDNQHIISILNHEKPIDMIVPWSVDAPITKGAEIVPFGMMRSFLLEQSRWKLNLVQLISRFFSCPKYFIQAPPPIASEDYLRQYPGPRFQPLVEERGFSPISFRRKVSDLHARMYKEKCQQEGVIFLEPPARGLDSNGNLSLDAATQDSIHAGVVYGGYVIDQIRAVHNELMESLA